jgi:hypothetical protein
VENVIFVEVVDSVESLDEDFEGLDFRKDVVMGLEVE